MSVDPKFSNLPWIVSDEPDVYESADLPESDQTKFEYKNDEQVLPKEIEKIKLSVDDAYKRFKNCKVYAEGVDFSDSISGTGKMGYAVDSSEYLSNSDKTSDKESIVQRYQRLQTEVRQLVDDAETLSKQVKADPNEPIKIEELTLIASALTKQMNNLQLQELFGPNLDIDLNCKDDILQKRIIDQIANFKPREKPQEGKPSEHITFDLYSKPSQQNEVQSEKLLNLDDRLQRIEALLGQPDPVRISMLTSDTTGHGLLEATNRLAARSSLLQPSHLDQIESRLTALQTKLQLITEKRKTIADADSVHKIGELYELVKKWHSVSFDLPQIVERLTHLQTLHEQASQFSNSLASMELGQKQIQNNLGTYKELLEQVNESVGEAVTTFKENVLVLGSRIESISK